MKSVHESDEEFSELDIERIDARELEKEMDRNWFPEDDSILLPYDHFLYRTPNIRQ